jgi:hypothetical protein
MVNVETSKSQYIRKTSFLLRPAWMPMDNGFWVNYVQWQGRPSLENQDTHPMGDKVFVLILVYIDISEKKELFSCLRR